MIILFLIIFECFTLLSSLAVITKKVKIGQIVVCNSYRNPSLLAKMLSTLDIISNGRLELGIGAGWYEQEYLSYGYEFPSARTRIMQLDESISIIKAMWTSASKSHDEAAIRDLYQQTIEGWNKGSVDALAAPYTEDSDYIGFDGTYLKGRAEIASFHQMLFDKFIKGSRLIGKIRSVRVVTGDVAVVVAVGGTVMAGQSNIEPDRNSIHTLVAMKRDDGERRFTAFQNTRADFIGRPEESQALTEELRHELLIRK